MDSRHVILNDWTDGGEHTNSPEVSSSLLADGEGRWWGGPALSGVWGSQPTAGFQISEGRALTSVTAFACSRARAETLASLPPIIYRQIDEFRRGRARQTEPWYLLHDEPNPHMDSMTFFELMNMRMVNRGNAFAEIERNNNDTPRHLWPIHPSRVRPVRVNGDIEWQVFTDVKEPTTETFRFYTVPDRDMLNICNFGGNGLLAPGVIDMGREEIALDIAVQQYGATFFGNGAKPAGIVEHPGYIDDLDQRREFREDMNKIHSGRENWNKIGVLWQGAKYKEMQASPEQAQFLELRSLEAKQLCRLWNVPPAIVQIFEDYKFNTVDSMVMQFVLTCVRADAVRFERAFNRKVLCRRNERGQLVDTYGDEYFLEFLLEGLLRGDAKKQAETMEIKRRNGVVNSNEWRNADNLNPLSGAQGERYIVPGGFADLETLGQTSNYKPANSAGGSDNASALHVPRFDKQVIIDSIGRNLKPRGNQVRGASVKGKSQRRLLSRAAVLVLVEAINRVNGVLKTRLARLSSKGEKPGDEIWEDHRKKLQSAVRPGCETYLMGSGKPVEQLVASVSDALVDHARSVGSFVSESDVKRILSQVRSQNATAID